MKQILKIMVGTSAVSVLAFAALAQAPPDVKSERSDYQQQRMAQPQAERLNGAAKASDLIGMEVKNYQDEKLGKVEDLAVDVESGRVVQVILSTGGFIGIGDRQTAVPPGALHHDVAQKVLHLDANKEKLKSAPEFEMSKWAESSNSENLSAVYRHHGQESAFTFIQSGEATNNQRPSAEGQRQTVEQRDNRNEQQNAAEQRNLNDGQRTADNSLKHGQSKENQSFIPAARLGQVQKASKVIGTDVKNLQDEKLGDVDNILVDLSAGRIVAVIISTGGFLGMNDELSAVPASALSYSTDRDNLQLDASKETLSQAPHFKANQWPDFTQPGYANEVHRAYSVEPYFSSEATPDSDNTRRNVRDRDERTPTTGQPDNTKRNVRDRDDQTLTPFDQSNSKTDVDTTAQIRREITAADGMSVNARNVKIITQNGRVTLRGPVQTAAEKQLIGEIANRVARAGNVDNQLEVKLTPGNDN